MDIEIDSALLVRSLPREQAAAGIVAVGASAGGVPALLEMLPQLPRDYPLPILVGLHMAPTPVSRLVSVLAYKSNLPVVWAAEGELPLGGTIHVCPPGMHLTLAAGGTIRLSEVKVGDRFRPSIDVMFESIASVHGENAVAVVLSGMMWDGMRGMAAVISAGGLTIAQCDRSAQFGEMPVAAIDRAKADIILPPARIAAALVASATRWQTD